MKKKLYAALISLMGFALTVHADTIKLNGLTFTTGSDTAVVKSYSEIPEDGKLTIPSEIKSEDKAYRVTAIKNSAFITCTELKELTIGKELKYIENYAFSNCINLKKVTLEQGDDILYIDKESFEKCPIEEIEMGRYLSNHYMTYNLKTLKKVTLSDNIKIISASLFCNSSIEEIDLSNIEKICEFAFGNCLQLQNVDIKNVIELEKSAFSGSGLQKITIPNCTEKISQFAICSCYNLSSMEILGNPIIERKAFAECHNLESVVLSDKINSIPMNAFENCTALKTIDLSNITIIESEAFSGCSSLEDVKFDSIIKIGNSAFYNTNIKNLSFGKSLSEVEWWAFMNCQNLTSVDLSSSNLLTLNSSTFSSCKKLESINFPSCLQRIEGSCFSSCKSLKQIDLSGTSVTTIPSYCFENCTELTEVHLNEATDTLLDNAFNNCSNLTTIKNTDNIVYIGKNAFFETAFLSSFTHGEVVIGKVLYKYVGKIEGDNYGIADGIVSLSSEALRGQDFSTIKIGPSIVSICDDALSDCKSLLSVTFPESITEFGNISGCDNLANITFKSSPVELKSGIIDCQTITKMYWGRNIQKTIKFNVPSLSNLTVGEYVTNLNAFSDCVNITTLDLEDSDIDIDLNSFDKSKVNDLYMGRNIISPDESMNEKSSFRKLSSLSIGNRVTYIPNYFIQQSYSGQDENSIKEITIPSSVKKIGKNAFNMYSQTIEKITLNEGLEEIGDMAFNSCTSNRIEKIRIPSTVKTIGMMAFGQLKCDKLEIPEGVCSLGTNAFYNLETDSLVLPSTLKLGWETFAFSKLKYVDASKLTCKEMYASFSYNSELETIILPKNIEEIGGNEFWYCKKLDGIEIPASVKKIGQNALVGTKQRVFVIPSNVNEICSQYFEDGVNKTVLDILGSEASEEIYFSGEFSNIRMLKTDRSIKCNNYVWFQTDYLNYILNCDTLVIKPNCDYIKYENIDYTNIDIPIVYNLSRNVAISNLDKNKTIALYVLPESKDIAVGGKEIISVLMKEYEISEEDITLNYSNNTAYTITPLFYKNGELSDLSSEGEYELYLKIEGSPFDGVYPTDVIIYVIDKSSGINEIIYDEDNVTFYNLKGDKVEKNYKGIIIKKNGKKESIKLYNK